MTRRKGRPLVALNNEFLICFLLPQLCFYWCGICNSSPRDVFHIQFMGCLLVIVLRVFHFEELRAEETYVRVGAFMLFSQMIDKVTALNELSATFPTMEGSISFDYIMLVLNSEIVVRDTLSFGQFVTSFTG